MTYEQTLERIEKQKKAIDGYPVKFMFVGITEDYENVKEALEKQIPKKRYEIFCPFCLGAQPVRDEFNYCPTCGQRLG